MRPAVRGHVELWTWQLVAAGGVQREGWDRGKPCVSDGCDQPRFPVETKLGSARGPNLQNHTHTTTYRESTRARQQQASSCGQRRQPCLRCWCRPTLHSRPCPLTLPEQACKAQAHASRGKAKRGSKVIMQ